jgi:Right handed beta helix region
VGVARTLRQLLAAALTLALASAVLLSAGSVQSQAASGCTKVASPTGSDDAEGTEAAPYLTLEQLVESLDEGEVGCLRAGTYGGDSVYFDTPRGQLRSYPGELATITAFMEVRPPAVGAHIHHLRFDASHHSNNTGVKLQADHTVFSDNELTKGGRGVCLLAGSYHPAQGIVIERNHIYDCGPSSSKLMHQLYLSHTRGAIVRWNILDGNAGGWGVHLYTDADDTLIEHNVIDGNQGGVIFAGTGGETSDRNVVRNNAITSSSPRWNIEGSWSGDAPGQGNVATDNCVHSTGRDAPSGIGDQDGFTATANTATGSSPYVDRLNGDFRFDPSSPCATLVGDVAGAVAGAPSALPAPAPATQPAAAVVAPTSLWLTSSKRQIRPTQPVRLSGRLVRAPRKARSVVLQVRRHGRWRDFGRVSLRASGRFSTRVRLGRARQARVLRMRAVVPELARSRPIKLRVRR